MSVDSRSVLLLVTGLAAIMCLSVWLHALFTQRGSASFPGVMAGVFAVIFLAGLRKDEPTSYDPRALGPGEQARRAIQAEVARVDSLHRGFAPALEQYRQEHGTYPDSLQDAGIPIPSTRYGPLHYYGSSSKQNVWYLISFGDPGKDDFQADWDSRKQKWVVLESDFTCAYTPDGKWKC